MKKLLAILLLGIVSFVLSSLVPIWWIPWLLCFVFFLIFQFRPWAAFLISFFLGGIIWIGLSWYLNQGNEGLLLERMVPLFNIGEKNMLFLLTAIIGALVHGLGAWAGAITRDLFAPGNKRSRSKRYRV